MSNEHEYVTEMKPHYTLPCNKNLLQKNVAPTKWNNTSAGYGIYADMCARRLSIMIHRSTFICRQLSVGGTWSPSRCSPYRAGWDDQNGGCGGRMLGFWVTQRNLHASQGGPPSPSLAWLPPWGASPPAARARWGQRRARWAAEPPPGDLPRVAPGHVTRARYQVNHNGFTDGDQVATRWLPGGN